VNDLRHHPRARTLLRAVVARGPGYADVFESVTTDLGFGGLFLLGETPLVAGEVVSVDVDLGDGRGFCALAKVVRHQEPEPRSLEVPGYGLAFVEVSHAAAAIIQAQVARTHRHSHRHAA
jgi:hypothetical protein